jgi:hypothetical protein
MAQSGDVDLNRLKHGLHHALRLTEWYREAFEAVLRGLELTERAAGRGN